MRQLGFLGRLVSQPSPKNTQTFTQMKIQKGQYMGSSSPHPKMLNEALQKLDKIQAAIAMEQRARVAGKASAAAVYRKFINQMKEKTKKMNEQAPTIGGIKMKKLGKSKPGGYKSLVSRHLGAAAAEKIDKSDGSKLVAKGKRTGNKELVRKGNFIKNVIAK